MQKVSVCMGRLFFCRGMEWLWNYEGMKFGIEVVSGRLVVGAKVNR